MKLSNYLLLIGLVLNPFLHAFADQECEANTYAAVFKANGQVFRNVAIIDERHMARTATWMDCYKYAIQTAKSLPPSIVLTVSGGRVVGGSVDTDAALFIKWRYNDGYFFDSEGEVTSATDMFVAVPTVGSLKYFENGDIFK